MCGEYKSLHFPTRIYLTTGGFVFSTTIKWVTVRLAVCVYACVMHIQTAEVPSKVATGLVTILGGVGVGGVTVALCEGLIDAPISSLQTYDSSISKC